jgi:hypothetical protein
MPRRYTKRNKKGGLNTMNQISHSINDEKYITSCRITHEKNNYGLSEKNGDMILSCETIKKPYLNGIQNRITDYNTDIQPEISNAQGIVQAEQPVQAEQLIQPPEVIQAEQVEPFIEAKQSEIQKLEPKIKFIPGNLPSEEYTIQLSEDAIKNPPSLSSSIFSIGKSSTVLSNFTFTVPLSKLLEIYNKDGDLGKRKFNKVFPSKIIIKSGLISSVISYTISVVDDVYYVKLERMFTVYNNNIEPEKGYSMNLDFLTRQDSLTGSSSDIIISSTNIDSVLNVEIIFHIDKRDKKDKHRVLIIDSVKLNGLPLDIKVLKRNGYEYSGPTEKNSYDANYKDGNKYYTTRTPIIIYSGNAIANPDPSFTNENFKDTYGNNIPLLKIGGKIRKRQFNKTKRRNYKKTKRRNYKRLSKRV